MSRTTFRELFAEAEKNPAYWTERAILQVTEEISIAMERGEVSRSELARRLEVTPAYVTKILRGDANFTLESIARIARVLGGEFRFHFAPASSATRSIRYPEPGVSTEAGADSVAEAPPTVAKLAARRTGRKAPSSSKRPKRGAGR